MNEYPEHRTPDELNELLRHHHFIPLSKPYTQRFVEKHYPGWEWAELVRLLHIGGVIVKRGTGGMIACDPRVTSVHFGRESRFAVEWDWMV